jgi:23S rRNA pseudouridine955/2504/2580 synthase/23S rRNA pseudouridine1911/1915/1917 synthase
LKGFSVIFENDDFIAVNKEAGMLTIPDRHGETQLSLYKILNQKYGKIFIVHRLDRDTSGLILFAKNEATHKYLSQLFEQRNIGKIYLGIVRGSMPEKNGSINEPIGEHPVKKGVMVAFPSSGGVRGGRKGKASLTNYEVLEDFGIYSLVQFEIQSGRTHQIRVHTKSIGHPVICDEIYGDGKPVLLSSFKKKYKLSDNELKERPLISRLALHSASLRFTDRHGEEFFLEAPLPKDMKALLQQLKKNRG